jgi:membrane protease YdiL (CAAX protease family)
VAAQRYAQHRAGHGGVHGVDTGVGIVLILRAPNQNRASDLSSVKGGGTLMDSQYKAAISSYTKKDAVTAIIYWVGLMVLYAAAGVLANYFGGFIGTAISLLFVVVCIIIIFVKKQGLSSIGLVGGEIGSSLIVGLLLGIVPVVTSHGLLAALLYGWELKPIGYIVSQFVYFLIVIALVEEIIFRGYIQTRLYGLFRNNTTAMIFGGVMFMLMHIPYQIITRGGWDAFTIIFALNLVFTFLFHIAATMLYGKFNTLYGAVLFHTVVDWSSEIFNSDTGDDPIWTGLLFVGLFALTMLIFGVRYLHKRRKERVLEQN